MAHDDLLAAVVSLGPAALFGFWVWGRWSGVRASTARLEAERPATAASVPPVPRPRRPQGEAEPEALVRDFEEAVIASARLDAPGPSAEDRPDDRADDRAADRPADRLTAARLDGDVRRLRAEVLARLRESAER